MGRIEIKGLGNVAQIITETEKAIRNEVVRRARQGGTEISNATKKVLKGQGGGKWYGNHQASAPGQHPAVLSGDLRNSFKGEDEVFDQVNRVVITSTGTSNLAKDGKESGVNPEFNYAWIDEGTKYMAPRPYIDDATDKALETMIKSLRRSYNA